MGVAVLASMVSVIGFGDVAGASGVTAVSFTPTTTAAGVYTDYLVGFTPTALDHYRNFSKRDYRAVVADDCDRLGLLGNVCTHPGGEYVDGDRDLGR